MATKTLSTLRTRARILLQDEDVTNWTETQIGLFINYALVKFTHDMPFASSVDYDVSGKEYTIPDNYVTDVMLEGYWSGSSYIERVHRIYPTPGVWTTNDEPVGYIIDYPQEGILYTPRTSIGDTLSFRYGAFHNTWLDEETDSVDLGHNAGWGELAVVFYANFLAFSPSSSLRAQLEQWARKGDLNVGNPLEEEANRWLKMYKNLLNEHAEVPESWEFFPKRRTA